MWVLGPCGEVRFRISKSYVSHHIYSIMGVHKDKGVPMFMEPPKDVLNSSSPGHGTALKPVTQTPDDRDYSRDPKI